MLSLSVAVSKDIAERAVLIELYPLPSSVRLVRNFESITVVGLRGEIDEAAQKSNQRLSGPLYCFQEADPIELRIRSTELGSIPVFI